MNTIHDHPDIRLVTIDTIDLPGPTKPDLYRAACDESALWREIAIRLAGHIGRINVAGDIAAKAATVHPSTRQVRTPEEFLAHLFNVHCVTRGRVTVIYDRAWLGDIREVGRLRMHWIDVIRDAGEIGVQLGPLTVWVEGKGGAA